MKKVILTILVAVLALAGIGIYKVVTSLSRAGERGDAAVSGFHSDYNANRIDAIHGAAASAFRASVPIQQFAPFLGMLHDKLGEWKSGDRSGINLHSNNGNTTLELTYTSKFAKAEGTEEFVFDYNGDAPVLIGYNVKSPALIEKPAESPAAEATAPVPAP